MKCGAVDNQGEAISDRRVDALLTNLEAGSRSAPIKAP